MTTLDQADVLVPREAREAILAWYAESGRQLAFRATADPYAVLVSGVLAQQTQAARAAISAHQLRANTEEIARPKGSGLHLFASACRRSPCRHMAHVGWP